MTSKASYDIINTGSKGNAVTLGGAVLIDCGVPFKALQPHIEALRLVLLTHRHGDHFNAATIRALARDRPTVRFGCGPWLAREMVDAGVDKRRIDILRYGHAYDYGIVKVTPVQLTHDVPNCGYTLRFPAWTAFYATDTASLNGVSAPNYDLYLVECNYEDAAIRERISEKKAAGEYAYERRAMENHLSKRQCDDFIYKNAGPMSEYVYLHCHEGEDLGVEPAEDVS